MVPTIYPTALFDKLDEFMLEFIGLDKEISAGVASEGEAAAYAEVWEWGNVRQHKSGPKTVLGTNPAGKIVWLTIQAPFGYIKINENIYWQILRAELAKVEFKGPKASDITKELEAASVRAMKQIAQIIGDHAPKDHGDLSKSFKVVMPGDNLLDDDDSDRILMIDMEDK